MKTGRTLTELATELERQAETRKDYIAAQGAIAAEVGEQGIVLAGLNGEPVKIEPHAHRQLATHLEIPQRYYDRMLAEQPDLLAKNVNTWLQAAPEERRMVRTLDGKARAFLSARYRPLDNFELAHAVLPTLVGLGVDISSCELTETRMYIKGILPSLSDALPEGLIYGRGHADIRQAGGGRLVAAIVVSNSEVGDGTLRVEPSVFTTWCTNLCIIAQASMKKYHVGRSFDTSEDLEAYRDETRQADDKAFFLKVRDVTAAAFAEEKFKAAIEQIRNAGEKKITSDNLPKVVEVATKRLGLPEGLQTGILTFLARGGDLSAWGLSSAITEASNGYSDYEGATAMERAGGQVLTLGAQDWKVIAEAA
jgi:hypothetical protein